MAVNAGPFIWSVVAALTGACIAIIVFFRIAPVVRIRLIATWLDANCTQCCIRVEVENVSSVPVKKKKALLQVFEHSVDEQPRMNEFVPLTLESFNDPETTEIRFKPRCWKDPCEILKADLLLYPREVVCIEHLEQVESPGNYLHIAVQFKCHLPLLQRFVLWAFGWKSSCKSGGFVEETWTTTALLFPTIAAKAPKELLRTSLRRSTGIRWKKTRNDLNGRPKVVLLRRP
jgi:hypothetical protein